ncbi:MarR family transcriptional regulator [uncultured Bifidobacterium sp.]|uniref:MarR family transcriptional regulator n=1 Tax=uncultured Bifidobacterium sp. TaxID=165187 RepID=UPI00261B5079|nr:MarR family transcriptional regulator [uncultured Bifidobacterium sp.]
MERSDTVGERRAIDETGTVEKRSIGIDISSLNRRIRRYLSATMPDNARIATGGNAHIIMFLARHRAETIVQRDIERRFCITRSTASRVLALMERKGLIVRESVPGDARMKRILLTDSADAIVEGLVANAMRMEEELFVGFTPEERGRLACYIDRLTANIDAAQYRHAHSGAPMDGPSDDGEGAATERTKEINE